MSKIKNIGKLLEVFDLPTGSLFLPGLTISRDLTDDEIQCRDIQKALKIRKVRMVKDKPSAGTAPFMKKTPVASADQPVADAEPNVNSGSY